MSGAPNADRDDHVLDCYEVCGKPVVRQQALMVIRHPAGEPEFLGHNDDPGDCYVSFRMVELRDGECIMLTATRDKLLKDSEDLAAARLCAKHESDVAGDALQEMKKAHAELQQWRDESGPLVSVEWKERALRAEADRDAALRALDVLTEEEKSVLRDALEHYATDLGQRMGMIAVESDRYDRTGTLERIAREVIALGDVRERLDRIATDARVLGEKEARIADMERENATAQKSRDHYFAEFQKSADAIGAICRMIGTEAGYSDDQSAVENVRQVLTNQAMREMKLTEERKRAWRALRELESSVECALSQFGVEFMDPPDGGDVSLAEQMLRMATALAESRAALRALEEKEKGTWLGQIDPNSDGGATLTESIASPDTIPLGFVVEVDGDAQAPYRRVKGGWRTQDGGTHKDVGEGDYAWHSRAPLITMICGLRRALQAEVGLTPKKRRLR